MYDEELLEPYEWVEADHIKTYSIDKIYVVRKEELEDLFLNIIVFDSIEDGIYVFTDLEVSVAIHIEEQRIKERSLLLYDQRIHVLTLPHKYIELNYRVIHYLEYKELYLTRYEKIKRQKVLERIDILYRCSPKSLKKIVDELYHTSLTPEMSYQYLKSLLSDGYKYTHEFLYYYLCIF